MTLPANGMFHLRSLYSVPETMARIMARIEELVGAREKSIMARTDFAGDATKLIFGNPKMGSPCERIKCGHRSPPLACTIFECGVVVHEQKRAS